MTKQASSAATPSRSVFSQRASGDSATQSQPRLGLPEASQATSSWQSGAEGASDGAAVGASSTEKPSRRPQRTSPNSVENWSAVRSLMFVSSSQFFCLAATVSPLTRDA